jgi:tight adherence protein B
VTSAQAVSVGLLVAAATALTVPRPRLGPGPRLELRAAPADRRRALPGPTSRLALAVVAVLAAGVALASGLRGVHLVVGLVCVGATVGALRLLQRAASARAAATRRQSVIDLCEALVGELQAGQPLVRAVERAAVVWPESEGVAASAALGADVPEALRRLAQLPGAAGLGRLAAAWDICAATGGGLAFAAEQVLHTARAEVASDRRVEAELASARATARLVAMLPVVVLVAADGIGARPWQFLLSTGVGVTCLGVGVVLGLSGLWWIERIAASASEGG